MKTNIMSLYVGLALISLWSWYTTSAGWAARLGDFPVIWSFGLAAILQFLLAQMALRVIPVGRHLIAWPVALLLYLILATLSITFSIAFYFQLSGAGEYAESAFEDQYTQVRRDASTLVVAAEDASDSLESLADLSQENAAIEADPAGGGTCQIDRGGGAGPYYRTRSYEAELFTRLSRRINERIGPIREKRDAVVDLSDRADMSIQARFTQLSAHVSALRDEQYQPFLSEARDVAEQLDQHYEWHANGYPNHSPYEALAGSDDPCNDTTTLSRLNAVSATLTGLPTPEQLDFAVDDFDPADAQQVVDLILGAVGGLWLGAFGADRDAEGVVDEEVFSDAYIVPVALGVTVDAVILLLGIFIQLVNRPKRGFLREGASPADLNLTGELFVSLYDRMQRLEYLGNPEYGSIAVPRELKPRAGRRPEQIGTTVAYVESVIELVEVTDGYTSYLFEPCDSAVLDPLGHEVKDLIRDIRERLDDWQLIGTPWRDPTNHFNGMTLSDLKNKLRLTRGLQDDGEFHVWQIHPGLEQSWTRLYGSADRRIDETPAGVSWHRYFRHIPDYRNEQQWKLLFLFSDAVKARYLLSKPKFGVDKRVVLFPDHSGEFELIRWLRSHNDGFPLYQHVQERAVRLFRIPVPAPWRVFDVDAHGHAYLSELAGGSDENQGRPNGDEVESEDNEEDLDDDEVK